MLPQSGQRLAAIAHTAQSSRAAVKRSRLGIGGNVRKRGSYDWRLLRSLIYECR